jgi:hypothetical protein
LPAIVYYPIQNLIPPKRDSKLNCAYQRAIHLIPLLKNFSGCTHVCVKASPLGTKKCKKVGNRIKMNE